MAAVHTGMHMVGNSKRNRITYRYQNVEVCVNTYLFLHAITLKLFAHGIYKTVLSPGYMATLDASLVTLSIMS